MSLLLVLLLTNLLSAKNNSPYIFKFSPAEYTLSKGELPCTDGYVGWMDGEPSLSFMLGFKIVFTDIDGGLIKSKNRTIEDCKFDSITTQKVDKLTSIENTVCKDSTIKKIQKIEILKDGNLSYQLQVFNNKKIVRNITCKYNKENK